MGILIQKISNLQEKHRIKKKLFRQRQPVEDEWQGYEVEKLVKDFHRAMERDFTLTQWRELLERILFTLTPYYDNICDIQRHNIERQSTITTSMLSARQILTFNAALYNLMAGKAWESIHELLDFMKDFGAYKDKQLSEIETVLIYCLCQQIVFIIRLEENKAVR